MVVMPLREAVRKLSVGTGQGYVRCNCALTAKCSTNRCSCKFAKISCSSKCHGKSEDAKCTNKDVVVVEEIEAEKEPTSAEIVKEKEAVEPKKTTRSKKLKK